MPGPSAIGEDVAELTIGASYGDQLNETDPLVYTCDLA